MMLLHLFLTLLLWQAKAFAPSNPATIGHHKTSSSLSVVDPISFTDISNVIADAADSFPTGETASSDPSPLRIAGSVLGGVGIWYLCGFGMGDPTRKPVAPPPEEKPLAVVEETE